MVDKVQQSVFIPFLFRLGKKKVVFTVTYLEKNGSVGRDFFFQPKQLKCTYWLSFCFTSINVVFIKEKESYSC